MRERLVAEGRARGYTNRLITRLKMIFGWAVTEELLPSGVYEALRAVPGLKRGRTTARESEAVKPVPTEYVEAIRPHVSRQVAALIDLQLPTAARPGELCVMRPIDLDTTGEVWIYSVKAHKTAYHGHQRTIYLGPRAQVAVHPFLNRPLESYLFSPAEAEAERLEERSPRDAEVVRQCSGIESSPPAATHGRKAIYPQRATQERSEEPAFAWG